MCIEINYLSVQSYLLICELIHLNYVSAGFLPALKFPLGAITGMYLYHVISKMRPHAG